MKIYEYPTFNRGYTYYSLLTSILFILVAIYLYYSITTQDLALLLSLVGLFSVFHHARSYEQNYNDYFRYVDILFANILGLYIMIHFKNIFTLSILGLIICLFFSINKCSSPKTKSFIHSYLHLLVILVVFYNLHRSDR